MNRLEYYKEIGDVTLAKLGNQGQDLITYCLDELQGCEKLYGLMFIFTEMGNMDEEEKDLVKKSTALIIGDMVKFEDEIINAFVNRIVETFHSFDKLKDGYLVNHNYDEMEKYLEMRMSAGKEQNN
jgi:hypothetical protein